MGQEIKMVALDLDGTTLNGLSTLSDYTRQRLEMALDRGIQVVVATGRGMHTVPEAVRSLRGLRYYITANGAKIWDAEKEGFIYSRCIAPDMVERVMAMVEGKDYFIEIFIDGSAYVGQAQYDDVMDGRIKYRSVSYIKNTRHPVPDLFAFVRDHISEIESINIVFGDMDERAAVKRQLDELDNINFTSSFDINWEVAAKGVSKGAALRALSAMLDIPPANIMACGDSINDLDLLLASGVPVAVANARDELKEAAVYVTDSNLEDGVAKAMDRFIFGEKGK